MRFTKTSNVTSLTRLLKNFLKPKFHRAISFFFCLYESLLRPQFGYSCKFHPTCSHYAKKSFQTHGLAKGFVYSTKRLLRCHPLSSGGFDPVPAAKRGINSDE